MVRQLLQKSIVITASAFRKAAGRNSTTRHRVDDDWGAKNRLLEEAALSRGFSCRRLNERNVLVTVGNVTVPFFDMNGPHSSLAGKFICDNKHHARRLLAERGLAVIDSFVLARHEVDKSITVATKLGYPVVVKPINLSRSRGITAYVSNDDELTAAVQDAFAASRAVHSVIIEKYFEGEDYRFNIVAGDVFAIYHRARARVTGDGISTVDELIAAKNRQRSSNEYLAKKLIPTSIEKLPRLLRSGRTLNDIPGRGEIVTLHDLSNLMSGGDSFDVLDTANPTFKEIAIAAIEAIPGIRYGGVDILTKDITQAPTSDNYVVSEVEFSPGPGALYPVEGIPRNLAAAILDYYISYYANQIE